MSPYAIFTLGTLLGMFLVLFPMFVAYGMKENEKNEAIYREALKAHELDLCDAPKFAAKKPKKVNAAVSELFDEDELNNLICNQ